MAEVQNGVKAILSKRSGVPRTKNDPKCENSSPNQNTQYFDTNEDPSKLHSSLTGDGKRVYPSVTDNFFNQPLGYKPPRNARVELAHK